ncbi:MAG: PAS domain S-box protein, partial [Nodosilinea sp.]
MTGSSPTVLFLLESAAEQVQLKQLLSTEPGWDGQIIESLDAATTPSGAGLAPNAAAPDVVLLDWPSYEARGQDLQTRLGRAPAFVLLLDAAESPRAALDEVDDFLYKSQLDGTRLWITIRNLWRQRSPMQPPNHLESGANEQALLQPQLDPEAELWDQLRNQFDGSRGSFESIYAHAAVGICLATSDSGAILSANQWFCDLLGYSEAELKQMRHADYSHPEDALADIACMKQLMAGEISYFTMEKRLFHRSGAVRWVTLTVSAVGVYPAQLPYSIAVIQDITEQKQLEADRQRAEITLQENRDFLQTMLDHLPVSLFVKDARPEHFGEFVLVNSACEHFFDRPRDHILGKTDRDLFDPEQADGFLQTDRQIVASRLRAELEEDIVRPHGGRQILQTAKVPIYDASGQPQYVLGISQDITAQKQAEADLVRSESSLEEAQRLSQLGNWECNPVTGQLIWSKELLRQYGFDELIQGPTFEQFVQRVHPDDWPALEQAIQALMTDGTPYEQHHRIVCTNGAVRHTFCKGQAVVNDQNQVVKVFGVSQNITALRQTEAALRRSEQKHRALVQAIPDLIIHMSGDGIYLDFFAASNMTVLGEPEELIGRSVYGEGLPPEQAKKRMRYIQQALATDTLQVYEQTLFNGKETVTEEVRVVPIENNDVLVLVRDITEAVRLEAKRQQAEDELRASREFIEHVTDSSPNVIYIYDLGKRRTLFTNAQAYTSLGYTCEDTPPWAERSSMDMIHPDEQDQVRDYFASLATLADGELAEFEYRMQHKDGDWRWFLSRDRVFKRDRNGQVTQILGNAQDVTLLKQSQLALQHANAEMNAIFETFPDLLFHMDIEGTILDYKAGLNNPNLYLPPAEFVGQKMANILPAEVCTLFAMGAQQILAGQPLVSFEYQLPMGTRQENFEARLVPFQNQQVIVTVRNISDRKRAEAALEQAYSGLSQRATQLWLVN